MRVLVLQCSSHRFYIIFFCCWFCFRFSRFRCHRCQFRLLLLLLLRIEIAVEQLKWYHLRVAHSLWTDKNQNILTEIPRLWWIRISAKRHSTEGSWNSVIDHFRMKYGFCDGESIKTNFGWSHVSAKLMSSFSKKRINLFRSGCNRCTCGYHHHTSNLNTS